MTSANGLLVHFMAFYCMYIFLDMLNFLPKIVRMNVSSS